jgi:hypothetical protein
MIKELEDYSWFPAKLRRWQLEFVGHMSVWTKLYKPLAPVIDKMISNNQISAMQDCCSGSGIPAVYIHQQLQTAIPLLLTDKFPDESFVNKPTVIYAAQPVDILQMQTAKMVMYTMFNAFHHFTAAQQKQILQQFVAGNSPFVITEILEPGFLNAVKIFFTGTLLQLFAAPFVQPFSFTRLFFTYIIPVNLFTVTYDGIISVVRSKTSKQYEELFKNMGSNNFVINVGKQKNWKGNLVYIKGEPVKT